MEAIGTVAALWRYPVKSLAPQRLSAASIDETGVRGDRTRALMVSAGHARLGKPYRGKEHDRLHLVGRPEEAFALARERGVAVEMHSDERQRFFDAAPISLLFDVWVGEAEAALNAVLDPLRWRPNIFARAAGGFRASECDLAGTFISAGNAVFRVRCPIERCVTTTYDPYGGESDPRVLAYVARRRANVMGVYCDVELAGVVRDGDPLRLRTR